MDGFISNVSCNSSFMKYIMLIFSINQQDLAHFIRLKDHITV